MVINLLNVMSKFTQLPEDLSSPPNKTLIDADLTEQVDHKLERMRRLSNLNRSIRLFVINRKTLTIPFLDRWARSKKRAKPSRPSFSKNRARFSNLLLLPLDCGQDGFVLRQRLCILRCVDREQIHRRCQAPFGISEVSLLVTPAP